MVHESLVRDVALHPGKLGVTAAWPWHELVLLYITRGVVQIRVIAGAGSMWPSSLRSALGHVVVAPTPT